MIVEATSVAKIARSIDVRELGMRDYLPVLRAMQEYTERRDAKTQDAIWWLQHPPVYTQGLSCKQTTLGPSEIEVVPCDRGGQITYHGPGQLVIYVLYDLTRRGKGPKWLVNILEQAVLDFLRDQGIVGERRTGAPGVYVQGRKLAALGLRVRHGASYHGLSVNVGMDLSPFANIHPCGYEQLEVTQLKDLGISVDLPATARDLTARLCEKLTHT